MVSKFKQKYIDRYQFLALIGPFTVFLTLLAASAKIPTLSWYLILASSLGFPLIWKWGFRGFLSTFATLSIFYLSLYSFFGVEGRFWNTSASISLILGFYITYLGFEEVKRLLLEQQIESQSRLDNLIEIDDRLNQLKKDWDLSEESYQSQIDEKNRAIEKLNQRHEACEKSLEIIENELDQLQEKNAAQLKLIESVTQKNNQLNLVKLNQEEKIQHLEKQLNLEHTEREAELLRENEQLIENEQTLSQRLSDLEDQLSEQEAFETHLSQEAKVSEQNIRKLEDALREKVLEIQSLKEIVATQETEQLQKKSHIDSLQEKLHLKEQDILSQRAQMSERDQKINRLSQEIRDLKQDVELKEAKLSQQLTAINDQSESFDKERATFNAKFNSINERIEVKDLEIEKLYVELEDKGREFNELEQLNKESEQAIQLYENQVQELNTALEEKEKNASLTLKKLNDLRTKLYQEKLVIEYQETLGTTQKTPPQIVNAKTNPELSKKHWLMELEQLLKKDKPKKIELENLPKELSQEIVTLNQTKALYKQLRTQFDEKGRILDETREKLFKIETQYEKLQKQYEDEMADNLDVDESLEKSLSEKEQENTHSDEEIKALNEMIQRLLLEVNELKG